MAARIAAHAADLVKNIPGAWEWDEEMSRARRALDWKRQVELAIDPVRARYCRDKYNQEEEEACSMCGDFCAMKIVAEYLGKETERC